MSYKRSMVRVTCQWCSKVVEREVIHPTQPPKFCGEVCRVAARRTKAISLQDRFWAKVNVVDAPGSCWEWNAGHYQSGYGAFGNGYAHRTAWNLKSSAAIPKGFFVLHTCDNPPCVRNDEEGTYVIRGIIRPRWGHLWLGTPADNAADMIDKGRDLKRPLLGEAHGNAKLTDEIVREIRAMKASGEFTQTRIAAHFGIDQTTVSEIVRGRSWVHI